MYLESPQNPRVKAWGALKTKKGRTEAGQFLVEGLRLVRELLASEVAVHALLWNVGGDELPDDVLALSEQRRVPVYELAPGAFGVVADTVTPQGVVAVAELPDVTRARLPQHAVLLDGVQDPGNVGTLIRSADAFALGELCCGSGTADPFSPKGVRATMGGLFRLSVCSLASVTYVQQWQRAWPDGQVLVTAASAPMSCHQADLRRPTLLVIGSEAFGVSTEVVALANGQVKIPMSADAESLNAAVAGAILMYELHRQQQ
ncbi:23S rRNA methyltransferase [Alicyclobacillus contaminans]|uniref:TrmH family RNA methyltransferase n=1 Tax=Alicyclobacillus contaminans TaxID=392016 RepID=UPI0004252255|nr:RNA methyltransferase [Alicyclobacillus contaminans]GMA51856.1 23S rRNA methyltransferase [Alicyclobacillus contaminans]